MDMDLMSACESLAANILEYDATDRSDIQISEPDIEHWQQLFNFTRTEAIEQITNWRLDFGRESLPQTTWEAIKESATGFSKESYEFSLAHRRSPKQDNVAGTDDAGMYLLRIQEETQPSIHTIQSLLNTKELEVVSGLDDQGNSVQFCYMSAHMRNLLQTNLAASSYQFRPSFIRVSIAKKDLSDDSRYPTLGIDSTLPQYRAQSETESFRPKQNEYPVPYFFYGTLADRAVLARVLGSAENGIEYEPAMVSGAALTTWANKYRGLINGGLEDKVGGSMYWVQSREEEEALRIYETAKYEVVRCSMHLQSDPTPCIGLTFRLINV